MMHLRFKVGPLVITQRVAASEEKRSIEPVLWSAVGALCLILLIGMMAA